MMFPKIKIRRVKGWVFDRAPCKIILDGRRMGEVIRTGQEREIMVEEGKHELSIKIGLLGSNCVNFEINGNDDLILFECGVNLKGWQLFLPYFHILFRSNSCLWVRQKSELDQDSN